jgi:autotransporter-associated beta strand protein
LTERHRYDGRRLHQATEAQQEHVDKVSDPGQHRVGQTGTVSLGAETLFITLASTTFAGVIADGGITEGIGGSLVIAGGVQILTGNNTYTGGSTTNAAIPLETIGGALQIGNGGTSGSIVGNVANSGALVFDRADNVAFVGVISGTGSVTQQGAGVLTLTGNNTYTGGTIINPGGMLQIGAGGTTGSIVGNVTDDFGALVFDRSDTITFGGAISGTGSLTQCRRPDSDRNQHLHRRNDDQRRHAADRQWRDQRVDRWQCHEQRRARFRPRRQPRLRRRHQRNRVGHSAGRRHFDPDRKQHL